LSANFRWKGTSPLTIVGIRKLLFLVRHSEDRVILCSFWIGYQRVTDGRTDRQTNGIVVGITALYLASNAAAL